MDFKHVIPPYLHLILGLVNDVVKEMYKDLTRLGCVDPEAAARALERQGLLEELENAIAAAVGDLAKLLGDSGKEHVEGKVQAMPKAAPPRLAQSAASSMEKDAAGNADESTAVDATGVRTPLEGEYVEAGSIAGAEWKELIEMGLAEVDEIRREAQEKKESWLKFGDERRAERHRGGGTRSRGARENKYAQYVARLQADADEEVKELEAAVEALHAATEAYKVAMSGGGEGGGGGGEEEEVDDGVLVAAMKEALSQFGISVQRYWKGTVRTNSTRKSIETDLT